MLKVCVFPDKRTERNDEPVGVWGSEWSPPSWPWENQFAAKWCARPTHQVRVTVLIYRKTSRGRWSAVSEAGCEIEYLFILHSISLWTVCVCVCFFRLFCKTPPREDHTPVYYDKPKQWNQVTNVLRCLPHTLDTPLNTFCVGCVLLG